MEWQEWGSDCVSEPHSLGAQGRWDDSSNTRTLSGTNKGQTLTFSTRFSISPCLSPCLPCAFVRTRSQALSANEFEDDGGRGWFEGGAHRCQLFRKFA